MPRDHDYHQDVLALIFGWRFLDWVEVLLGISIGLGLLSAGHAVINKRDPRSASLWVILSFLLPTVGPFLYLAAGINRTQRRARRRMVGYRFRTRGGGVQGGPAELPPQVGHLESLARLGDRLLPEPLVGGNAIEPLFNGEQTFPAMLEAIAGAQRTITCCSYIYDFDDIGRQFIEALVAARRRGVQVKLLIDGIGGYWYFSRVHRTLKRSGLRPASFAPLGLLPSRLMHLNLRNHRKILVIDGRVGFTGGLNISACQLADNLENPHRFMDVHFRLRGPIVTHLQNAFADDWDFATDEVLEGPDYFPPQEPAAAGEAVARGIADGPDEHLRKLPWIIIGACQAARRSIRIMTPYFIPDAPLKSALIAAALRGVAVTILIPKVSDVPTVKWASTAYLWEFLEHGIQVVWSGPPFHHTKLMLVDDRWTLLGSANLDPRSLRLNFEFDVEVYDPRLFDALSAHIDAVAAAGDPLTLKRVDGRSLPTRLRDGVAKLFSPYL
jgi:cardiolipin synthase